jgi:hypothetical protein
VSDPIDLGTPQVLDAVAPPEQLDAWMGYASEMPAIPLREDELAPRAQAHTSAPVDPEQIGEDGSQPQPSTARQQADETALALGQSEVAGADLFDEEISEQAAHRHGLLPPSFFQGPLPASGERRNEESVDSLKDLFIDAYAYDSPPTDEVVDRQLIAPAQSLPDRTTPIFGMPSVTPPRPLRATRPSGGYRPRTSGGTSIRRITPVLSRAITPISTPVIPLHPGLPYAPAMSPTPASVPVLVDYQSSRAVVHALETVASQIRIGHLVVVGDVPDGDDVASLAAGVAAALAALLGVRE